MNDYIFDYESLIGNTENIRIKEKVNKQGKLNCSSNELIHPKLSDINEIIIKKIDFNKINNYIYYKDKIRIFSELLGVSQEKLQLYSGSDDAIKILLTAFHKNSKNLIIQTPNYENYYSYASLLGYNIVHWECMNDDLHFGSEDGINIINSNMHNSIVVITNPNGFTGALMSKKDLRKIAECTYNKNDILIIDQAYLPFSGEISYYDLQEEFENVILISTLSKGYGLAGARIAYTSASAVVNKYISKWNGINTVSALSYEIAEYYLKDKAIKSIINDIIRERDLFIKFINENTNWQAFKSYSNFILVKTVSNQMASEFTEYMFNNNIVIRHITDKKFEECVRITAVYDMNRVKTLICDYLNLRSLA